MKLDLQLDLPKKCGEELARVVIEEAAQTLAAMVRSEMKKDPEIRELARDVKMAVLVSLAEERARERMAKELAKESIYGPRTR
jgi:hypothetical protein